MSQDLLLTLLLVLILIGFAVLLTALIMRRFALNKMHRTIMKAEHNYQQQIFNLQQQLSAKVAMLENMVEKLTLSNNELNRLNEIKSKFMSVVAHDLRQPLSSIQGLTSVLMLDGGAAGGGVGDQAALNNILKATDNMNMLMSDLMDISMMEAGKFKMDFRGFDFNGLINDVCALQTVNAQKRGISIMVYEYPEVITVSADRFRISQVLNNLLSNSIKFTPQGGRVEVRFLVEGIYVQVTVKDNGPGIKHSDLQKVFEKFHQSDALDKRSRKQGWGLGLAISYEIIRAHNGEIFAESGGLGHGAAFIFRIPLKQI